MSIMDEIMKGIRFQVCGQFGDPLRIVDQKSGEISRFIRILGFGKTYNLDAETDEALAAVPVAGTPVRAGGLLGRRSKSAAASAKISELSYPGKPNWKSPTEEEILSGCKFGGWGIVAQKKSGEFRGSIYRNLQVNGFGETYLFNEIDAELFERLPESGPIYVTGHLDTLLTNTPNGRVSDLLFVLENFRTENDVKPAAKPNEAKPAA